MRLNRVYSVAIRANGSLPVTLRHGGAVDAGLIFLRDGIVALATGHRHIEFEDRRFRIFRVQNFVRAVTIGADCRFFRSVGNRVAVHTLLIRSDHLRTQAILFHHKLLTVAGAASCRDVRVMNP